MSAKESKVSDAQRERNGDSRGPHQGRNGSNIDIDDPQNGDAPPSDPEG